MDAINSNAELSRCVRCGTCKTLCPTYLTTRNETMGARGRVAMLGELGMDRLAPTGTLAEKIFSCMLCGACKGMCPVGIDIPEVIYRGRAVLKKTFGRGRFARAALRYSAANMDTFFSLLRMVRRLSFGAGNIPEITSRPFRKNVQLFKNMRKIGRVAIFAGCSVNYFYPRMGNALSNILMTKGYETVVFKGESCCGAPFRSMGLEDTAAQLAQKNIELFSRVRAEAIISICPTCTMVIKEQYPVLTGRTIDGIMDVNEFFIRSGITGGLETAASVVTYHDPCHMSHGLRIKEEPRKILKGMGGIEFVEMEHADECCGFGGLFSRYYKEMSMDIGNRKLGSIAATSADTVVTSCPGCIMQLEHLRQSSKKDFRVMHIIELVDEAMRVAAVGTD